MLQLILVPPSLACSTVIFSSLVTSSSSWCHAAMTDLATRLNCPSLPGGLQSYVLYQHGAVVYRFLLPLLVHVKGSTRVCRLRVRPYFSSSGLHPLTCKVLVFVYFFDFFHFRSVVRRNGKILKITSSFFFLSSTRSGLLAGVRWFVCFLKSQRILYVLYFFGKDLYIYPLLVLSNLVSCTVPSR